MRLRRSVMSTASVGIAARETEKKRIGSGPVLPTGQAITPEERIEYGSLWSGAQWQGL